LIHRLQTVRSATDAEASRPQRRVTGPRSIASATVVVTDTARIGGQAIKVELVMITDAGRRAIEL